MALPQVTLEIRWFFPGIIPEPGVQDWFLHTPRFGAELTDKHGKAREDLYLLTPGSTAMGPKLREGRFEIKLIQGWQECAVPGCPVNGRSEVWHKWQWPYATNKANKESAAVTASFLAGTPENLRVVVGKKRWQRKFRCAGPGDLAPLAKVPTDLPWWISAELTALRVQGAPWWTLAVEVCEHPDDALPILQQSAAWMLLDYPGPPLGLDNSLSYPEWLAGRIT
jgi:hypothetical protein